MVRYAQGYYWVCPKCQSSYGVSRNFVDTKMKCVCGDIYVIEKGDGTVVMRDGDVELPANAPPARDDVSGHDKESDLLSQALDCVKKCSDLLSYSDLGDISNFDFPLGDRIYEFSDVIKMISRLNEMIQRTINRRREEVLNKIKKEMHKYGFTPKDLI